MSDDDLTGLIECAKEINFAGSAKPVITVELPDSADKEAT